jgi:hypothetical protein
MSDVGVNASRHRIELPSVAEPVLTPVAAFGASTSARHMYAAYFEGGMGYHFNGSNSSVLCVYAAGSPVSDNNGNDDKMNQRNNQYKTCSAHLQYVYALLNYLMVLLDLVAHSMSR